MFRLLFNWGSESLFALSFRPATLIHRSTNGETLGIHILFGVSYVDARDVNSLEIIIGSEYLSLRCGKVG